ncbi:Uncharacterised protein [BD1-7 clade bacterium]|uniref:HD domain-containing protein n=1 Tax=BD1-7 clade bacterium TaxID=2029982 RepID=A0A5S9QPF8_9GAMM|nr:Uncharacterised protein [BD1-7 clade bacterium]
MSDPLDTVTQFLLEVDALKTIDRRTYIKGGSRLENSAEHSWHLAMACWALSEHLALDLCQNTLIKLALVHDLGEIDAGDTFLYADSRNDAHEQERECVARLQGHAGNPIKDLMELWDTQEYSNKPEAKLLKVVDRILPFLLNIENEGRTWRELGVKRSQVVAAHAFINEDFPQIHEWLSRKVTLAVVNGWLIDA